MVDATGAVQITGEIAGLLKISVPWMVKVLRSSSYNSRLASIPNELYKGSKELEGIWADIPKGRQDDILHGFNVIIDAQINLRRKQWWKSLSSTQLDQCMNDIVEWSRLTSITSAEVRSRNLMRDQPEDTTQLRLVEASNNVGTDSVALIQALRQEISNLSRPTTTINIIANFAPVTHETTTYNNSPSVEQQALIASGGAVQHSSDFLSPHPIDPTTDPTTEASRMSEVVVAITNAVMQATRPEPASTGEPVPA